MVWQIKKPPPETALKSKVFRAKLVLFWEELWKAVFLALCLAGIFLILSLTGILEFLPRYLHFLVLGAFLVGFGYALRPAFAVRPASEASALRRLETASQLPNRPASAYRDEIAGAPEDPASLSLWQAHKARLANLIAGLRSGWPKSGLASKDPYALRYLLILVAGSLAILTGADGPERVKRAIVPVERNIVPVFLDAWVSPPNYTGKAPVFLARGQLDRTAELPSEVPVVHVPVNSEIIIRISGASEPELHIEASGHGMMPVSKKVPFERGAKRTGEPDKGPGTFNLKFKLERPQQITVHANGDVLAAWGFGLIDDNAPQVNVSSIRQTGDGSLNFDYETKDDYGVGDLSAKIKLAPDSFATAAARGTATNLFPPPNFSIDLPRIDPRSAKGEVFRDLAAHPWAGLAVEMIVTARDGAGQTSEHENAPLRFILPERIFTELLARAVIEQRRVLVRDIQDSAMVTQVLRSFMIYPDGLIQRSGVYLGLNAAHKAMMNARSDADFADVVNLLWEIALSIEDGNLSVAERNLRKIRQELAKALAENAPASKIAELMDRMRKAMDRYMRELAQEMQRRMQEGRLDQNQKIDPNQVVTSKDLQKMMDQIEKLARSGARDAARKLLSELERLMENMRPGAMTQRGQQRNSPTAKTLQELGELMNRQQQLMDETFQMPERNGQNQGDRQQNNQQGPSDTARELARQQGALGELLKDMMEALRNRGMNAPQGLGKAQGEMRGAQGSLGDSDRGTALGQQGRALDNLRQGAQSMANEMMRQGTGQQGAMGNHEQTGQEGQDFDPLGRPGPTTGETHGGTKSYIPDELAIERAQEILRDLRNRFSNPNRPRIEMDYLERLMREIY
jgi:uncharacterized protein (TIGR02302 family)